MRLIRANKLATGPAHGGSGFQEIANTHKNAGRRQFWVWERYVVGVMHSNHFNSYKSISSFLTPCLPGFTLSGPFLGPNKANTSTYNGPKCPHFPFLPSDSYRVFAPDHAQLNPIKLSVATTRRPIER